MRAPARAQDLILAQRVKDYRAGELERRYPRLARQHGCTHPRDLQAHFDHGRIKRWGGTRIHQAIVY